MTQFSRGTFNAVARHGASIAGAAAGSAVAGPVGVAVGSIAGNAGFSYV